MIHLYISNLPTDPITRAHQHNTHPPRLIMMNYIHILLRTTHYCIHLHITNSDPFLDLSELPTPVKVLT